MRFSGRLLLTALLAGLAAGLALTLAQRWLLPIVLEVENYLAAAHSADSFEVIHTFSQRREFMLTLGNVLFGAGFGLLLVSAMALRGSAGVFRGLLWGLAGYLIFSVLPAMTLGAGLPGQALPDLAQRQWWWLFSASFSAVGLALAAFSGTRWLKLLGVSIVLMPFIFGPPPATGANLIPGDLARAFSVTRYLVNAVFWAVLGMLSGYLLNPRPIAGHSGKN